jgi:hypothetical protein
MLCSNSDAGHPDQQPTARQDISGNPSLLEGCHVAGILGRVDVDESLPRSAGAVVPGYFAVGVRLLKSTSDAATR